MHIRTFPEKSDFCRMSEKANVIPVCTEILADTETPVSLLKKFYMPGKPLFLFESVEGGERWGRYSFLGLDARCRIRIFADNVEICENGQATRMPHNGDPLKILREIAERFRPAEVPGLPRFWGGLVGYFTYEMVSFFEKIPCHCPADTPLAHFVVPDRLVIFDNVRHTLVAVALAFPDTPDAADGAWADAVERIGEMLSVMARPLAGETETAAAERASLSPGIEPAQFKAHVGRIKAHILAGDVIQAVYSQPFACPAPPDLWMLYRAQRFINPSPYMFFMHLDKKALVGSSPETMVRLENGVATLRPIAGTRPRGTTEQEDRALADELLADEKERAEHLMLVDLGRNDLGRVARTGSVQVTDLMVVERYSHVMHLVSNINCQIEDDLDAWDLIRATFPAGTLSGAPKVRAMEIIAELENDFRGTYGGAVGYISFSGNMDLAITIRTACIEEGRMTVRAGAGIVADSDPEKERQETVNKATALEKALELMAAKRSEVLR
jgi:anthranilate synthase component I